MKRRVLKSRRGVIVVLAAVLMVVLMAMIAFSVDIGYVAVTKTQLQTAADSAALAACATLSSATSEDSTPVRDKAKQFAGYHTMGGLGINLQNSDIEFGTWDAGPHTFTPSSSVSNAVRITTRCDNSTGGNQFFFGLALGKDSFTLSASAVATGNPRDIVFVVDLSGSMNDDTEPAGPPRRSPPTSRPQGLRHRGQRHRAEGVHRFQLRHVSGHVAMGRSAPAGVTADNRAYANLTKNSGHLTGASIAAAYKISSSDSESTRKTKAYKWMIDYQIAVVMPNAKPTPNSTTNYNYWEKYLDYVIENVTVNSGSGTPPNNRGALPPNQDSDRITGLNNPNSASFPSERQTPKVNSYRNKIGYRTYVQFMMDHGRSNRPDGSTYVPLSLEQPRLPDAFRESRPAAPSTSRREKSRRTLRAAP